MNLDTPAAAIPDPGEPIFARCDDFIIFHQYGVKLVLDRDLPTETYVRWLDAMRTELPRLVPGGQIVEKEYARAEPRLNTGIYYDTPDRQLLRLGAVLRTTCNKMTHAFCAFKQPQDAEGIRKDHRHVFEGAEKRAIQSDPTSSEARAAVVRLLARTDIDHPGRRLRARYGIDPASLTPSIRVAQLRHPFYVWLDRRDALRCVMDRADVTDLRAPHRNHPDVHFRELELPIFPRIKPEVAADPRTLELITALQRAAIRDLGATLTEDNKYQRAARELGVDSG